MFRPKNLWIPHLLGWLLFLALPLTIIYREQAPAIQIRLFTSVSFWAFILVYVFIFYLNALVLIPKLFLKQKHQSYAGTFVVGLLIIFYSQPFENLIFQPFHFQQHLHHEADSGSIGPPPGKASDFGHDVAAPPERRVAAGPPSIDFVSLVLFIVVWVVALATKISEQWRLSEKRATLSEADKAQAELSFFKAQINPHFLFNTLNNIYALAISNSEHTAASIMRLSKMMRYITEEATEDFVPLRDEINCLENYVDLQRLRLNGKTVVDFKFGGDDRKLRIAPLILMTFVENAFKYGVSSRFENRIEIRVEVKENMICFTCKNHVFEIKKDHERAGIGIANTQKRLDFLYPNRHTLKIRNFESRFEVNLELTHGTG